MTNQTNLASLLDSYMKRASIGDARLANQVNSINGNACFIHRSTLRNWRTGSVRKVNNWRQLATVAIALNLDETEANTLLESGGCLSIQVIRSSANETDKALLTHWQTMPVVPAESTTNVARKNVQISEQDDNTNRNNSFMLPDIMVLKSISKKRNIVLCIVAMFGFLSLGYYKNQPKDNNLLINSHFEHGTTGWISYVNEEADASFEVDDGAVRIEIKHPTNTGWHIGLNQKNLEITAGKFYTARFRVRGDGVASMYIDITRVIDPKTSLSFDNSVQQKVTSTKNWTTKTIEFEATETITEKDGGARLFFRFGKSEKGMIVLDDIELFEGKLEQDVTATHS